MLPFVTLLLPHFAPALADPGYTTLGPTAFSPALPLSDALGAALAARDHTAALAELAKVDPSTLSGTQVADFNFLHAWELQRTGHAKDAVKLLQVIANAQVAPRPYVQLVIGEILLADGRAVEAIDALKLVDGAAPISVRAQLALAGAYEAAQRNSEARAVFESLAARPDPSSGSEKALWVLAQRGGKGSKEATDASRRLYRHYPNTGEDRAAAGWFTPTLEDIGVRGDRMQEDSDFADAVTLLETRLSDVRADDCVYRYAYGRAQHKINNITTAASVLAPLGKLCQGKDDDRGAKALYLAGKSYERKKESGTASTMYAAIPTLYPTHSMADDGYALGGIARQDSGDLPGARALWALGVAAYPTGDLAAENAWRLAWGAWLANDVSEAVKWADHAAANIPVASAPTDVLGAMYWAGRWRAYPTRDGAPNPDERVRLEGEDRLARLAADAGWHFYGALAQARLSALNPARAAGIARPTMDAADAPWQVRDSFAASPAVQDAMGLARVGLVREALTSLAALDQSTLTGAEMAVITLLTSDAGDFLLAHDRLRGWLKTHPPETLGPNAYKVLRVAYPNQYWSDIQTAASGFRWDPRVFHSLVREESNFNPKIKSHAGACGLSQLMPGTASGCAKRMGVSYSSSLIWDIPTNLKIGAWYLDTLHTRYGQNPMLALAGYNAGEGNADRWLAAQRANAPTDEIVESITFRETRHYVKRVLSTYQTYRLLYGEGALYPDWSKLVVDAVPG